MLPNSQNSVIKPANISPFPNFQKINLSMQTEYEKVITDLQPYADYSFANLFIWLNLNDDLEISSINRSIVIRYSNIFERHAPKRYTLIGSKDIVECAKEIVQFIDNPERLLYLVPEEVAQQLKNTYIVEEDRDSFDYILSVDEQIHLLGSKFGKSRRKINGYMRTTGEETIIRELDLNDPYSIQKVINALHSWDRVYDLGGNDTERLESLAIENTFKYHQVFDYKCICIYVNRDIEAFTLFRINRKNSTANINHTKTSYKYRHIFDFAIYATASKLKTMDVKYINFEQDLGIPGLREHKQGLRPIKFLKKYNVQL